MGVKQTEALKLALEASEVLEALFNQAEAMHEDMTAGVNVHCQITVADLSKGLYAAHAIREALAEQPVQNEPAYQYLLEQNRQMTAEIAKFRAVSALALEALEMWCPMTATYLNTRDEAITAIREALADSALERMAENERELGLDYMEPAIKQDLTPEQPAQQHGCSRSHPHENMDVMCELRTDIARLTNENARLRAQQQEPYGWKVYGVNSLFMGEFAESDAKAEAKRIGGTCITFPLYTSPPASKPWVGLTECERTECFNSAEWNDLTQYAELIEAKLREKNT